MLLKGNQGTVTIKNGYAEKKYHGNLEVSNKEYFLYEVENLHKILPLNGNLKIFQTPIIHSYDINNLTIQMSIINHNYPYIVDFCPMIRDKEVFYGFIDEIFTDYVCQQHSIKPLDKRLSILKESLIFLAEEFSIYYTDPKKTNVFLGHNSYANEIV